MGLFDIPSVDIGFSLPKECENAIVEVMSDAAMGVAESVLGGDAFENPFGGGIDGVTDMLNGSAGIMGKLDGLLSGGGLLPDQEQMLNDLKNQFGGEDGLGGMIGQMAELKQHTNMMSGVGDLGEFTERLGMAGSLDGAMQRLGQGEGGFGNLFKSFENVGGMVDNLKGSLGPVMDMLDGGIDGLDTGLLGSMKDNLGKMGEDLIGQVNADNLALGAASMLVEKLGVADMISSNNCYIKDLMSGAIGSPKLMESLPASLEEKFGPELKPEELAAVKQVEEISIEESKKAGVHSPALAGMAGSNVVKSTEKKKEVAGRPVFEPIKLSETNPDKNIVSDSELPYLKLLEGKKAQLYSPPIWHDDIKGADGKPGVWIQWYAHASERFDIPNKVVTSPAVYKQKFPGEHKALQVLVKEEVAYDWNGFGGNLYYLDIFDSFTPAFGWNYNTFMRLEDVSGTERGIGRVYGKFHKLYCEALMWNTKLNTWTSKKISKDMDVKLHPWANYWAAGEYLYGYFANKDAIWGDVELADGIVLGYDWPQVVVDDSGEPHPKHFREGGKLYYSLYNPVL